MNVAHLNQHRRTRIHVRPRRQLPLDRVAVVIPALNEEAALPLVLGDLPAVGQVIVVDNGSTDGTAHAAREAGVLVVEELHRGYGSACLRGLAALAEAHAAGATPPEVVVFLDGDYSDRPEFLPRLIEPILNGQADFVLGSRLRGRHEAGATPTESLFENRLACWLMRALFGARYSDLCPFRAIRYRDLCQLGMEHRDFGWIVEMQIKAAKARLRVEEVPIPCRRRVGPARAGGTFRGWCRAALTNLRVILQQVAR